MIHQQSRVKDEKQANIFPSPLSHNPSANKEKHDLTTCFIPMTNDFGEREKLGKRTPENSWGKDKNGMTTLLTVGRDLTAPATILFLLMEIADET